MRQALRSTISRRFVCKYRACRVRSVLDSLLDRPDQSATDLDVAGLWEMLVCAGKVCRTAIYLVGFLSRFSSCASWQCRWLEIFALMFIMDWLHRFTMYSRILHYGDMHSLASSLMHFFCQASFFWWPTVWLISDIRFVLALWMPSSKSIMKALVFVFYGWYLRTRWPCDRIASHSSRSSCRGRCMMGFISSGYGSKPCLESMNLILNSLTCSFQGM